MQERSDEIEIINQLKFHIAQRDAAIRNLEDFIAFQNNMLKQIHSTREKVETHENAECERNTSGETSDPLQTFSEESNYLMISHLFDKLQNQEEELKSMQEEFSAVKHSTEKERMIDELKSIIHDLQMKLDDKISTNLSLVRSIKMQNELISDLRFAHTKLKILPTEKDWEKVGSAAKTKLDSYKECQEGIGVEEWKKTFVTTHETNRALALSITRQSEAYLQKQKKGNEK